MMHRIKKMAAAFLCLLLAAAPTPNVYADTNGSELLVADRPDKLILQLGSRWAGVEFELRTDSGVFPVPVVVDANGVLRMDLGGSKTYTLSCLASAVAVPPVRSGQDDAAPAPEPARDDPASAGEAENRNGVPAGHLVLFLGGLAAAVGGLLAMRYFKRRRDAYDYDEDGDDYE
jgi:hypothetical protein